MRMNRRAFLKSSAAAAALAAGAGGIYDARRKPVRLALIGAGDRGQQLAKALRWTAPRPLYGEVVAVCDAWRERAEALRHAYFPAADVYQRFTDVLQRDDVAGIVIATPDHWHAGIALAALAAGKAVYCEKPLTLTVEEGQRLIDAVERSRGLLLVGTQQRSSWRFQRACELVRNGRLGRIERVDVWLSTGSLPEGRVRGPFRHYPLPDDLDWDLWLGQAPFVRFLHKRYNPFRWWFEYSGGLMTDWGAHHLDIVHWALGCEHSGPGRIESWAEEPKFAGGYNTPWRFAVDFTYPGDVRVHVEPSDEKCGLLFQGDAGRMFVSRQRLSGRPVEEFARHPLPADAPQLGPARRHWGSDTDRHLLHFLDCIRFGAPPISDVISQHRSASACHLANISMRLGRTLRWDAARETFLDDDEANSMLSRPRREPYGLPAAT